MKKIIISVMLVVLGLSSCQGKEIPHTMTIEGSVTSIHVWDGKTGYDVWITDEVIKDEVTERLKNTEFVSYLEAPENPTGHEYGYMIETTEHTINFNNHEPVRIDGEYWHFDSEEDQKALMILLNEAYKEMTK